MKKPEILSVDPRAVGLYSFPEAGRWLQIPPATLRTWVSHGLAEAPGKDRFRRQMLSFYGLVGLLVVRELRKRGVRLQGICTAHRYLVQQLRLQRPFARQRFWTSGSDVFVKLALEGAELPVAASKYGQISFGDMLEESLAGVEYGPDLLEGGALPQHLCRSGMSKNMCTTEWSVHSCPIDRSRDQSRNGGNFERAPWSRHADKEACIVNGRTTAS